MPSNTTNISFIDAEGNNQEVAPAPVPNYIETDHQAINEIMEGCSITVTSKIFTMDPVAGAKVDCDAAIISNGAMVVLKPNLTILEQLDDVSGALPLGTLVFPFVLFPMNATGVTITQNASVDQFSIHIIPMAWGTITRTAIEGDYAFNINYLDYPATSEDTQ